MNTCKPAALLFLFFCACNNPIGLKKTASAISNSDFLADTRDSTKTTREILDRFLPGTLILARADTSTLYFGATLIEDDSLFRQLVVGKLVDKSKIIAAEVNLKDTVINFYSLHNGAWKPIGSEKTNISVYSIEFEDLDGDNKNEIITSTFWNMNGNSWKEVYRYSDTADLVRYAGSFSTGYEVRKDKKQIEETYTGSWYMDQSKTLYEWRHEKLVPIRQIIVSLDDPGKSGKQTLAYYENPTGEMSGLRLKFREPYHEDNKKEQQIWDNFFISQ